MKIKMVIWDLDNTLWDGVLDEGEVVPRADRVKMIRELNDRGVVNSVCSKNDPEKAVSKLGEISLLDEIVFPAIAWTSKGPMVKSIIEDAQLRAENILFVDDEETNLKEVSFYNAGINTLNVADTHFNEVFKSILDDNKPDGRKRFNQYRNLEKKRKARLNYSDSTEFLRESDIVITLDHRCDLYLPRIEELVNRTNQLNFTKSRLTTDELRELLSNNNESFVVFARDKFGDYGLIGFVSVDRSSHTIEHFAFSCRVLNMGIEQYIYDKLDCPRINIVGAVSSTLVKGGGVDWIRESKSPITVNHHDEEKPLHILMAGGCDLYQMHHLLKSDATIETYFNYPSRKYGVELHRDSLIYLYGSKHYSPEQQGVIINNFPFVERDFFEFPDLKKFDLVIYSPLVDYLQNIYAFKDDRQLLISWGDYTNPTGSIADEREFLSTVGLTESQIADLSSKWLPIGPMGPEEFTDKLKEVFDGFSGRLVLIGGASKHVPSGQEKYIEQHVKLNEALKSFQRGRSLTSYIDIDDFIMGIDDFAGSLRHYKKNVYSKLAQYIVDNFYGIRRRRDWEVAIENVMRRVQNALSRIGVKFPH